MIIITVLYHITHILDKIDCVLMGLYHMAHILDKNWPCDIGIVSHGSMALLWGCWSPGDSRGLKDCHIIADPSCCFSTAGTWDLCQYQKSFTIAQKKNQPHYKINSIAKVIDTTFGCLSRGAENNFYAIHAAIIIDNTSWEISLTLPSIFGYTYFGPLWEMP